MEEEGMMVLGEENKPNVNGKEGKETSKKEREEEVTGLLKRMNMERKEGKGKNATKERDGKGRLEDKMEVSETLEEKREKLKQETKDKDKKLKKRRMEKEEENEADNQKDEKKKENTQDSQAQHKQEKDNNNEDEEIKGKKGHTFSAQLPLQVELSKRTGCKARPVEMQGTPSKARRCSSPQGAVTSLQAWLQAPGAMLTPARTEGSVRVRQGTAARYDSEEAVFRVLSHSDGPPETAALPPPTIHENREGPGREGHCEALTTTPCVPSGQTGGMEVPATDQPTADGGLHTESATLTDHGHRHHPVLSSTPTLHERGTSQLRLARLWARRNLRARRGLAVRCHNVCQALKRHTRGLVTEGAARHAVLLQFPEASVERLPQHLPRRRRETLYFCHVGPRRSSPHLPQLLPHTRRLSRQEERLVEERRPAHRRAQVFCRAALRYTGRQDHQLGVAGLYRRYCALERRAGTTPLARQTFLHTIAAAFPAARVLPHGGGTPALAIGVQPAQNDFW